MTEFPSTSTTGLCSLSDAQERLLAAWPMIVDECRATLGSELHYQAVVYHCLRVSGVPRTQLGMNVKQWIDTPVSALFQTLDLRKHENFRGGFEPIPDVVIFGPEIAGDWRRRRCEDTLRHMLIAIEVKASERANTRLSAAEIIRDIRKLQAHRKEVRHRGADMQPVMLVIDTAPLEGERMVDAAIAASKAAAAEGDVSFLYLSPTRSDCVLTADFGTASSDR